MIGGGITNTLDILGGQKIQDYLGGAGTATKGPGGGTLYTQGQERPGNYQVNPTNSNTRHPKYNPQIAVHNIDDQGNITGQTGLGRVVAQYGNIKDLDSFSPELQAAIQGYQSRPEGGGIFGNQGIGVGALGPTATASAMGETRPALYDPRQRAIDEGYQPGSGFMYEGKFYESGNPGRISMDMAPLDSLFANNPAAREAFKESGSKLVMNSNPNPQAGQLPQGIGTQGPGQPGGILGKLGPDPSAIFANQAKIPYNATVSPDPFSDYNVADAYKKSDFYDDSMQSQGYLDFLQDSRDNFMRSDTQQNVKSAAYNDARSKIFDAYDTFNPITNQAEQEAFYAANPGIAGLLSNERKYDDGFFADPTGQQLLGPGTDTTDSFGIGSNPIMDNPIAPMPSMPTAPNTQPGHSHDDLLSGIGKLFEQYFPQQGSQQINQPSPMFDAAGNSVPDGQTQSSQVFGNMITPNFGGGY